MTDNIAIGLAFSPSMAERPLGISIRLDGRELYREEQVTSRTVLHHFLSDQDGEHELEIEMFGKTVDHAHLDSNGNFEYDSCLELEALEFDDIDVMQIFQNLARYQHNFNGAGEAVTERCYGTMGCNGVVTLKFSTPIYLWLLENM